MRLPSDPADLTVPRTPDFRCDGWELLFGRFQWFYVVGARSLLARAGISDYGKATKEAPHVKAPSSWVDEYGAPLEWNSFAGNQVLRAIHAKPQRFDRAVLSVQAVANAISKHSNGKIISRDSDQDICDFVKIKPANFEIVGFDSKVCKSISPKLRAQILGKAKQRKDAFLDEISKGHGATYHTLSLIAEELSSNGIMRDCAVTVMNTRQSGALRPAQSETVT